MLEVPEHSSCGHLLGRIVQHSGYVQHSEQNAIRSVCVSVFSFRPCLFKTLSERFFTRHSSELSAKWETFPYLFRFKRRFYLNFPSVQPLKNLLRLSLLQQWRKCHLYILSLQFYEPSLLSYFPAVCFKLPIGSVRVCLCPCDQCSLSEEASRNRARKTSAFFFLLSLEKLSTRVLYFCNVTGRRSLEERLLVYAPPISIQVPSLSVLFIIEAVHTTCILFPSPLFLKRCDGSQ